MPYAVHTLVSEEAVGRAFAQGGDVGLQVRGAAVAEQRFRRGVKSAGLALVAGQTEGVSAEEIVGHPPGFVGPLVAVDSDVAYSFGQQRNGSGRTVSLDELLQQCVAPEDLDHIRGRDVVRLLEIDVDGLDDQGHGRS